MIMLTRLTILLSRFKHSNCFYESYLLAGMLLNNSAGILKSLLPRVPCMLEPLQKATYQVAFARGVIYLLADK